MSAFRPELGGLPDLAPRLSLQFRARPARRSGRSDAGAALLGLFEAGGPRIPADIRERIPRYGAARAQSALSSQSRKRVRHGTFRHQRRGGRSARDDGGADFLLRCRQARFRGRHSRQPAHAIGLDRAAAAQRHPHRRRRRHRHGQRRHGGYPDGRVRSRLLGASRQHRSAVGGMVVHAGQELGADAAGRMARRSAVGIHRCRRQHHARKPALLHRTHQHRRVLRHRQDARPADVAAAARRCAGACRAAASTADRSARGGRRDRTRADASHGNGGLRPRRVRTKRTACGRNACRRLAEIACVTQLPAGAWRRRATRLLRSVPRHHPRKRRHR